MKKQYLTLIRVLVLGLFMLPIVSCQKEYEPEIPEKEVEYDPSKDTTSVAVTGPVKEYGMTYAVISSFANLQLLPTDTTTVPSGSITIPTDSIVVDSNTVDSVFFGIELMKDTTTITNKNDNFIYIEEAIELVDNEFEVEFHDLKPNTRYMYRSYVKYDSITVYGKYNMFTSRDVPDITSAGDAFDITRYTAAVVINTQKITVDKRDMIEVGFAYATSKTALTEGGSFSQQTSNLQDAKEVDTIRLSKLSMGTTYYYSSFAKVNGTYKMHEIKEFSTAVICDDNNHVHAVDLGLSVKWSCCNVDATNPLQYGNLYAWGEIETKDEFSKNTYIHYNNSLEKCSDIGSNISKTEYDVAHKKWGEEWRMPTKSEIQELYDKCSWRWTSVNGVNGYLITAQNGNTIFLPAGGYTCGTNTESQSSCGYYWSATVQESNINFAYGLFFDSKESWRNDWKDDSKKNYFSDYRLHGMLIRPVKDIK